MSHLAFGGKLIWGDPDGPISSAFCPCNGRDHGANSKIFPVIPQADIGKQVLDGIMQTERESSWLWKTWPAQPADHPRDGYPTFHGWPFAGTMVHQQFHVEWLRRAYDGGLRLLSCLATNNRLLAWLMSNAHESWDDDTIRAQLNEMRRIAAEPSNAAWMEVVYSASQARDVIASDKLAIVLGAEVDQIELFLSHDPSTLAALESEALAYTAGSKSSAPTIASLAQTVYDSGIRQLTPLHFTNNSFGGAALYFDRASTNIHWLSIWENGGGEDDEGWPEVVESDEPIEFRLQRMQLPARRSWPVPTPFPLTSATDYYRDDLRNHINKQGLTPAGKVFLIELWRRGIIVDIDHMSLRTRQSTLELAEQHRIPVISSHCWVRDIVLSREQIGMSRNWWQAWDGRTPSPTAQPGWPMLTHEGMRSYDELQRVARLGGMCAPLLRQPAVRKPAVLKGVTVDGVDIMGTTTAAASAYLAIVFALGTQSAVAIGTDVNGLAQLPGPSACCTPELFDVYGPQGITRAQSGDRIWDINSDGVAHYGMLPDLFYRWRSEGMPQKLLDPLFRSALGYVDMWTAVETAARRISTTGAAST
jgi:hypothetical protein